MKCGFGGDESPRAVFKTIVGKPRADSVSLITSSAGSGPRFYVGEEAAANSAVLEIMMPITEGIVKDFELLHAIFDHAMSTELRVNPKECNCLITEAANNPDENRFKLFQMLFNRFEVRGAQCQIQAVLALYASGRTTGLVFDSGDGVSHTCPVYKGYGVSTAVVATRLAGRAVSERVIEDLNQYNGFNIQNENNKFEIARGVKEKVCRVALNYKEELDAVTNGASEPVQYKFKDGSEITCKELIYSPPEVLFDPLTFGQRKKSIKELLSDTYGRFNIEMRLDLIKNAVQSGGTTQMQGHTERYIKVFKSVVTENSKDQVRVTAPPDRQITVFCGGSILASLDSFAKSWITKEAYDEMGDDAVRANKLF